MVTLVTAKIDAILPVFQAEKLDSHE